APAATPRRTRAAARAESPRSSAGARLRRRAGRRSRSRAAAAKDSPRDSPPAALRRGKSPWLEHQAAQPPQAVQREARRQRPEREDGVIAIDAVEKQEAPER